MPAPAPQSFAGAAEAATDEAAHEAGDGAAVFEVWQRERGSASFRRVEECACLGGEKPERFARALAPGGRVDAEEQASLLELREPDTAGAGAGEEEQEQLAGGERLVLGELG